MQKAVVILGPNGRPVRSAATPSWDAAGTGRRTRGYQPTSSGPSSVVSNSLDRLRRTSRQEARNNPHVIAACEAWIANHIGTGLVPNPQGIDDSLRDEILDAWDDWVEDADADGRCDFYGMQSLVAREVKEAGEVFIRRHLRRSSDIPSGVPFQLRVLEGEFCDHTYNASAKGRSTIQNGIEFNRFGQRTAYHMWRTHPGDRVMSARDTRGKVRVPASRILHVYPVLRAGQIRGVPGFSGVLGRLREIAELEDAAILKQKIAALYTTFETIPAPDADSVLDAVPVSDTSVPLDSSSHETDVGMMPLEPGSHVLLPPGHDIEVGKPPEGSDDLAVFVKMQLRSLAQGAGVTYEQLSGDLEGVNFSSIRAGIIELYKKVEAYVSNVFVFQFCRKVWSIWLTQAQLSGRIDLPAELLEQRAFRRLQRTTAWMMTPGRQYLEPEKEVRAWAQAVDEGFTSRRRVVSRYAGVDISVIEREQAEDRARAEEAGNTYGTRGTTPAPAADPGADPADPSAAGGAA
jgi:lambda family phage portal protein